jgi:hypothetical protein
VIDKEKAVLPVMWDGKHGLLSKLVQGGLWRPVALVTAMTALTACVTAPLPEPAEDAFFLEELPDELVALAAPYQSLEAVRLSPDDGCYLYRHEGPVETTLLPLRTSEGRPICVQRPSDPSTTG